MPRIAQCLCAALLTLAGLDAAAVTPQQQAAKTDADAFAQSLMPGQQSLIQNPDTSFPNYTTTPPQTTYYGDPAALDADGANALTTDPNGQFLLDSASTRPQFVFDPTTDPLLLRSDSVTSDPVATIGQISETYTGCESVTSLGGCVPTFSTQTCDEALASETLTCPKTLDVQVTRNEWTSCAPMTWFVSGSAPIYTAFSGVLTNYGYAEALCFPYRTDGMITFRVKGTLADGVTSCEGWRQITLPETITTTEVSLAGWFTSLKPGTDIYGNCNGGVFLGYTGGCDALGNCAYNFNFYSLLSPPYTVTLNFEKPWYTVSYDVVDSINDQCTALDARL